MLVNSCRVIVELTKEDFKTDSSSMALSAYQISSPIAKANRATSKCQVEMAPKLALRSMTLTQNCFVRQDVSLEIL